MSVRTDMRLGERTHPDFSYIPNSSEHSPIPPNYHFNDISQSKYSSTLKTKPYHHSSRSGTFHHLSDQQMTDKCNQIKQKYEDMCTQIQKMKEKTDHFAKELNAYKTAPLSKKSKSIKSSIRGSASSHPIKFSKTEVKDTYYYRKDIVDKMAKNEFYGDIGTPLDIYNTIKDKVLERSLYLYPNKNCHTCAQCFSMGLSSYKCPKCHHLQLV